MRGVRGYCNFVQVLYLSSQCASMACGSQKDRVKDVCNKSLSWPGCRGHTTSSVLQSLSWELATWYLISLLVQLVWYQYPPATLCERSEASKKKRAPIWSWVQVGARDKES